MRDRRATINELRSAVDSLPSATKIAMLRGINGNEIIVGAYTGEGGVCPMLAAHRNGGRTNFIGFAEAWDRFAYRSSRRRKARRAAERELLVLRTQLEASLLAEAGAIADPARADLQPVSELARAMSEHQQLVAQRDLEIQRAEAQRERELAAGEERLRGRERQRRFEQRQARRRSRREHAPLVAGDVDRSRELRRSPGWAWTNVVRRYDDYERALARVHGEQDALREPELEPVGR